MARRCFDPARVTLVVRQCYYSKQEERGNAYNQIQEKDWAEESWHNHTGIDSSYDYGIVDEPAGKAEESVGQKSAKKTEGTMKVHNLN